MTQATPPEQTPSPRPTCARHPDRESHLRCQRCGRPACPECQRPAPVGFHCVDCLRESASSTPASRTSVGGVAGQTRPIATYTIIAICVAVYLLQQTNPVVTGEGAFSPFAGDTQPWRFLTSAFLHSPGMIMHILFNMLCLWQIGQWLEPMLGWLRFLTLYLVSAIGGSVGYLLLAMPPQSMADTNSTWVTPMVGASGAVFGLFGAVVVFLRHLGGSARGIWILLAINAVLPFVYPAIAWQAHLGGFLTGLALAGVLLGTRHRSKARLQWPALGAVLLVVVLLAVGKYAIVDTGFIDSVVRY